MNPKALPGIREIEAASKNIQGVACRTPLVESPGLSKLTGRQVYLKLECFQPIKVFKIRGAYNKISSISDGKVVAASSGNHGIAVSYSSHLLGKKCTVVVPETAVEEKVEAIESFGAEIVRAGRLSEEREAKARAIARASGAAFVHPFDDSDVIAGQGTCGLELSEQLAEFDSVLVPVGGGGLISGVSIALKSRNPSVKVYGVEPLGAAKLSSALAARRIVRVEDPRSIADGLMPSALGELAYTACSRLVDGAYSVSEEEIFRATAALTNIGGVIAEPSGAAPLAPLMSTSLKVPGEKVVIIVSGGNISHDLLMKVLSESRRMVP